LRGEIFRLAGGNGNLSYADERAPGVSFSITVILRFECLSLGVWGSLKPLFLCSRHNSLILMCLVLLCHVLLVVPVKSTSDEFPVSVVLGRYDVFNDTHWTVVDETVGQLKDEGFEVTGDVSQLVQANYTYLNYSLKSKVVSVSWPKITLQVTQGTYDLNLTVYQILTSGAIGNEIWTFLRSNLPSVINAPSTYTYPSFGVGFDPSVFTIGNTFAVSAQAYTVSRTETLSTPWGQNDTYVCTANFANATDSYSWTSWCDATSGLFLKNVFRSRTLTSTSYEEQEMIETGVENGTFDVVHNGISYQVSVHTNSTLDGFEFTSSTNAMRLTVHGPTGTFGICNITVPKSLVPTGNDLEVYVDGQKANRTLTDDANSYYVGVGYQHSTHTITVNIVGSSLLTTWWVWAITLAAVTILAGTVYLSRKNHHPRRRRAHSQRTSKT